VKKPRSGPHVLSRMRISAEMANTTMLVCRRGHTGKWRETKVSPKPNRAATTGRVCGQCFLGLTRQYRYGIAAAEFDRILIEQGGGCAICGKGGKLSVDHNHATGRYRGLLCQGCNLLVGAVENPKLYQAREYLERYQ
jgi:hypothetical protein